MNRTTMFVFASLLMSSRCAAQTTQEAQSLTSLVESERAFAATSLKIGGRPSFMQFFADDAVVFRPHPVKYKEAMKDVPMPKNPMEATLAWEPIWADVSRSGDLGYTTGPSVWTDHSPAKRPTYHGFYFSFWKKQASGEWKVVFDVGTELPGPYTGSRQFRSPAPVRRTAGAPTLSASEHRASLFDAERQFLESMQKNGVKKALSGMLDNEARIYRQTVQPILGVDSIEAYFSGKPYLSTWKAQEAVTSSAGDMGYTYGSYSINGPGDGAAADQGYFLHGWRRDASNRWKLVAEVTSPLPPDTPKSKK